MTIQWSGEEETPNEEQLRRRRVLESLPIGTMGHVIPVEAGTLPSASSRRDVAIILGLILLLLLLGAALWWFGPLPRVFPLMS